MLIVAIVGKTGPNLSPIVVFVLGHFALTSLVKLLHVLHNEN